MQPMKMHPHYGQNIHISDDGNTATRTSSFAHGICFGDRPLKKGEIFLVEIVGNERGWSGHLRIGLTQHNPDTGFPLPQYALPDFVTQLGKSWIMAITKTQKYIFRDEEMPDMDQEPGNPPKRSVLDGGELIRTSCGTIRRSQLLPQKSDLTAKLDALKVSENDKPATHNAAILPTEVGSRIGMMFTGNDCSKQGDLYIIVNGEEYGPMSKDVPLNDGPLWPVIDVYGTTKQVQIVHLTISETLQTLCRDIITQHIVDKSDINTLPLPKKLKHFLKFDS